ncbi:hypothetical protein [Streptomyces poonensis]|uniref:DUF2637 domain-containing protein n=2 Tax=Streptomyces poonensis TaxID=68255 RepID=A0A918UDK4_9ACTN|nr:hypothetical protein [Streptomyces poonensis]GGY92145.1 hypothetical protein GCM10010365_08260 [Streptomyces poonensis]GLJ87736.1 hypothetical protein GCM10017589_03360 [Streptomyces poonensis]
MHQEQGAYYPPYYEGSYNEYNEAGTGRHRAPADVFSETLIPPPSGWDPAEELAFMLQESMEQQVPVLHDEPEPDPDESVISPAPGTPLGNVQEITAKLPPLRRSPRKHKLRKDLGFLRVASLLIAALAAVIASSVSLFGGMAAYEPLRLAAVSRTEGGIVSWWPLLVYGPWLVASLSVLRAALHRRRAVHSWGVVLLFSSIAMLLCIVQAPKTVSDTAAAALPALASLVCFQQIVRQITLTRPPQRTAPRHRMRPSPAAQAPTGEDTSDATVKKDTSSPPPARQRPRTDGARPDAPAPGAAAPKRRVTNPVGRPAPDTQVFRRPVR